MKLCCALYLVISKQKSRAELNFTYAVIESLTKFFLDWLPVCYMLYCHLKAYRAREKTLLQANLIRAEEQSESSEGQPVCKGNHGRNNSSPLEIRATLSSSPENLKGSVLTAQDSNGNTRLSCVNLPGR